jgi:hypothetical protein
MATEAATQPIEDDDFSDSPQDQAKRWTVELTAAKKELKKFQDDGDRTVRRFKNEAEKGKKSKGLGLFSSNIQTQRAILYGRDPSVTIGRRFGDAKDDLARVSSEMLERVVNTDVEKGSDTAKKALGNGLIDRLLPGIACARVFFDGEFEKVPAMPARVDAQGRSAPEVPETEKVKAGTEQALVDYVYWKDFLWSPCRTWETARWVAFANDMPRKKGVARFGELFRKAPVSNKREEDKKGPDPLARTRVWEIWSKDDRMVYWFVEGMDVTLDAKPDTLQLENFWPMAEPMWANLTTDKLEPVADYVLHQDQYQQVDELEQRIHLLTKALKLAGAYDKTAAELKRMLSENAENIMIPVENWAMFAEKGGIAGVVSWFPLDQVVAALDKLRDLQAEQIAKVHQMTGLSDIMRGQGSQPNVTAQEQRIKANYGSVRIQSLVDDFARWASETLALKAEIICKHFAPETIIARSNIMQTADGQTKLQDGRPLVFVAAEELRSKAHCYRVVVKPEAVSLRDFAAEKQESTEFLQGVSGFMSAVAPVAAQMPGRDALPAPDAPVGGGEVQGRGHHRGGARPGDHPGAAGGPGAQARGPAGPEADRPADEGAAGPHEDQRRAPGGPGPHPRRRRGGRPARADPGVLEHPRGDRQAPRHPRDPPRAAPGVRRRRGRRGRVVKANEARLAYLASLNQHLGDAFKSIRVFDPDWRRNARKLLQDAHEAQEAKKK